MEIEIEFKNIKEVKAALQKAPKIVAKHIDKAIKRSIYWLQRETQPLTPVDTGMLRANQFAVYGIMEGVYTPIMDYAYWVHEGTGKMKARPFLQRGLDKAQPKIDEEFGVGLDNALEEIAKEAN